MTSNEDTSVVLEEASEGILHAVYDVVRGVERDGGVDERLQALRNRLESARCIIQTLHGTDMSPEEQLEKAESLQAKLIAKRRLLNSYKNMCANFAVPPRENSSINGPFQASQATEQNTM